MSSFYTQQQDLSIQSYMNTVSFALSTESEISLASIITKRNVRQISHKLDK